VAGPDVAPDLDPLAGVVENGPGPDRRLRNDDVVVRVKDQRLRAQIMRCHGPKLLSIVVGVSSPASVNATTFPDLIPYPAARTAPAASDLR
jgi:hypothetical protein